MGPRRWHRTVPAPAPLIGRRSELDDLTAASAEHRLVTLTGGPGFGKTRLAVELARRCIAQGQDAAFVDLSSATDPEDVCAIVAAELGLDMPRELRTDTEPVGRALNESGVDLVVLDNLEQVTGALPDLLTTWLALAPDTRFVATSRGALDAPAEHPVPLVPLDVDGSVDLFVFHAHEPLSPDDLATVRHIVARLEGIPLAILLAAARTEVLDLEELAARLERPLDVLRDPTATGDRHSTLAGAIGASWELLDPEHREGLGRLAAFTGGFTPQAAAAVTGQDATRLLGALDRRGLLKAPAHGRHALYAAVQQFVWARLDGAQRAEAEAAHADHFSSLVAGVTQLTPEAVDSRDRDVPNLNRVWRRAMVGPPSVRAAVWTLTMALGLIGAAGSTADRRLAWLSRALERTDRLADDATVAGWRARVRALYGRVLFRTGRYRDAEVQLERALAEATEVSAHRARAEALVDLAGISLRAGDLEAADRRYRQAVGAAQDDHQRGWALGMLGLFLMEQGSEEAGPFIDEAIELLEHADHELSLGRLLLHRGFRHLSAGRLQQARSDLVRSVRISRDLRVDHTLAAGHMGLAMTAFRAGEHDEAGLWFEEARIGAIRSGSRHVLAPAELGCALVAIGRDDADGVAAHLEPALAIYAAEPTLDTRDRAVMTAALAWSGQRTRAEAMARDLPAGPAAEAAEAVLALENPAADAHTRVRAAGDTARERGAFALAFVLDRLADRAELATRTWTLAADGSWFRDPAGAEVSLSNRPVIQRVAEAIGRAEADDTWIDVDTLIAWTWPGEKMVPRSARTRLFSAVHALRQLGLPVKNRRGRGYRLRVPVRLED